MIENALTTVKINLEVHILNSIYSLDKFFNIYVTIYRFYSIY